MPVQTPPPAASPNVRVKIGTDGIKVTGLEQPTRDPAVAALQAQVGVLKQRVERLKEERSELVSEADEASNRETQQAVRERLQSVQGQLLESETGLQQAEDKLAALGVGPLVTETREPDGPPVPGRPDIPDNVLTISVISVLFVGLPMAIGVSRWLWRRAAPAAPALPAAEVERLARLEQSVDAIAIELERISEGQRFVTKLLADSRGLGGAAAEPIRLPQSEAVPRP
jgi:DNA repair exonuclease SbcCD ATPase subunit